MVLFPPPFYFVFDISNLLSHIQNNWASEACPTLGCSIEISRDIYMSVGRSVCLSWSKSVGGITWAKRAHAQSQFWAVKSDR